MTPRGSAQPVRGQPAPQLKVYHLGYIIVAVQKAIAHTDLLAKVHYYSDINDSYGILSFL